MTDKLLGELLDKITDEEIKISRVLKEKDSNYVTVSMLGEVVESLLTINMHIKKYMCDK